MIVISDTSVIRYLVLLDAEHVLPTLFAEVIIPPAVERELLHPHAPEMVRQFAAKLPEWIRREAPALVDSSLDLDLGEAEAISFAISLNADLRLIDDLKGRRRATDRGLKTIGTLTVIRTAAERQLIDLKTCLEQLSLTNFRASKQLLQKMLDEFVKRPPS